MKVTKRSFNYGVKKSRNYASVYVEEGVEVDLEHVDDSISFSKMKEELKKKIDKEVENEIEKL